MLIFKIALRNIMRHKGKSFIIGVILLFGAIIMTIGNAVIEGTHAGINENLVNRFTGHIILVSGDEEKDNVLFTPMGETLKVISNYEEIQELLQEQEYIESFIPLTRGISMIFGLESDYWALYMIGTEFEEYQKMYMDNVELVEGELLSEGKKGVLITENSRKQMFRLFDIWVVPEGYEVVEENLSKEALEFKESLDIRNEFVFIGWGDGNLNTDILLPVIGIINFKTLNVLWSDVSFMDIESYRECFGYFTAADIMEELSEEKLDEFSLGSDEDIFGSGDFFSEGDIFGSDESDTKYDLESIKEQTHKSDKPVNVDSGAYNYVSIKLKAGVDMEEAIEKLNAEIENSGINARLINWKDATVQISDFIKIVQASLGVFIFLLFFVAVIVIMNTLSMAAIERTEEIGMMRAVGSFKSFIAKMFIAETSILSGFFGILGIILGSVIVNILSSLNLSAGNNEILHLVFGGDTFKPLITPDVIISGILMLLFITAIALIYPVLVARKITPLDAVTRN
jgi:ABC-type lipoprotein release transport system permease subunit